MGRPEAVSNAEILEVARRLFLEQGATLSASEIAQALGVSHTTIFNRFGSKEQLMLAALAPLKETPWVAALESGPGPGSVRDQLVAHAQVVAAYFEDVRAGLAALQAAGIDPSRACPGGGCASAPARAFNALTGWIERAQAQGAMAPGDAGVIASTILGALHGQTLQVCGVECDGSKSAYVERFIHLMWHGVGGQVASGDSSAG